MKDWTGVDRRVPPEMGGQNGYDNWKLLHAHYHHMKIAEDDRTWQSAALET